MRINNVKYIGFYDNPQYHSESRNCRLAATNKIDYITSAITRAGYNVEIVSPSWMLSNTKVRYEKQRTVKVNGNISVTFCPFWKPNKLLRNINIIKHRRK